MRAYCSKQVRKRPRNNRGARKGQAHTSGEPQVPATHERDHCFVGSRVLRFVPRRRIIVMGSRHGSANEGCARYTSRPRIRPPMGTSTRVARRRRSSIRNSRQSMPASMTSWSAWPEMSPSPFPPQPGHCCPRDARRAATPNASLSVGCGWIAIASWGNVTPAPVASAASPMRSPAPRTRACTPTTARSSRR